MIPMCDVSTEWSSDTQPQLSNVVLRFWDFGIF